MQSEDAEGKPVNEPLKALFSGGEDGTADAMIQPRSSGHKWAYTEGYLEAGNRLVASIEIERGEIDVLIFPVVFLYRQYLELQLKEIIRIGRSLRGENEKASLTHKLKVLWNHASKVISTAFPDDSDTEDYEFLKHVVNEFDRLDPSSETFRYATTTNGTPSQTRDMRINVRRLQESVMRASSILNGVIEYIATELQLTRECNP